MNPIVGLIAIGIVMLAIGGIGIYFAVRSPLSMATKKKRRVVPVNIELSHVPARPEGRIRASLVISPEVYAAFTGSMSGLMQDLHALRSGIPCWLSAPATIAVRMERHLAAMQGALGSIDIVKESVDPFPKEAPMVAGLDLGTGSDKSS